jgi:2-oxoglutarate ferredoxin oxidoreductase subunit alpha
MRKDVFTFLVGGQAGQGIKKTGSVASAMFANMGRFVFEMDDYQSLIRGGHNFSVVSTAEKEINSNYMKADLVVAFDKRSYELHKDHLGDEGIMVCDADIEGELDGIGVPLVKEAKEYPNPDLMLGVGAIAILACAIGADKKELEKLIEDQYPHGIEDNVTYANAIWDNVESKLGGKFRVKRSKAKRKMLTGNQSIALGAAAGGLDIYFAYPMTPSSSVLHTLAAQGEKLGLVAVHPENEIGVINMAIGSAFVGARAMVGTSGGGFALMQEAFSLAGMVEAPLLCYLGSRPGPSTGVPTYTAQGDLRFAIHAGHGEFPRLVASPGSIQEGFYLAAEMLDLVWRFQTPGILLTEKHLAESAMTVDLNPDKADWPEPIMHREGEYKRYKDTENGISPLLFPPHEQLIKWDSYEHDETGITTEDPDQIARMQRKRQRKAKTIVEHMRKMRTVNVFGGKGPVIFTYGSTTMSVLEALASRDIQAMVVQPIYLEPLPIWELEQYRDRNPLVVEQSAAGQFASLLSEKVGIKPKQVINKYDGRSFDPMELATRIEEVLK